VSLKTLKHNRDPKPVNPFQEQYVTCPVCEKLGVHQLFKPRLYVEKNRDVDLRPQTYQWTVRGFEQYFPPLFYMWQCKKCFFASSHHHFKNPVEDGDVSLKRFREALIEATAQRAGVKKVTKLLSAGIDDIERDFVQAFKLLYLGIFQLELVPEIVQKDCLNLGRYYSRLGWLFKDLAALGQAEKSQSSALEQLQSTLRGEWKNAPRSSGEAEDLAVGYFETALVGSRMIKTFREEAELILLICRIHLNRRDIRKAKQYLSAARARLSKFDEERKLAAKDGTDNEAEKVAKAAESRIVYRIIEEVVGLASDFHVE
jgi:uncharacterized protein (DUF2225 family)